MTVSKAIINWLKEFNLKDYWGIEKVGTDLMRQDVDYALVKEPVRNVKRFISGTEIITEHYQFLARLDSYTDADSEDNDVWMDALSEWIRKRNRDKVYPKIDADQVQEIGISSPSYMGRNDKNEAIYQMTIFIRYMKKGEQV